ncbi:MAG: hypothetical protein Q8P41_32370 [Pseudomonadota bacterium]|nr:hypothetical protein [Pseudomonadota bacterium]
MPTVLTLAPAFGGGRFGPFTTGNVSIGSDAQCQVLVSAELGVLPIHAWVTERAGGWTLHPGAPGAVLFVKKGGRGAPVTGPTDLAAGDSFSLATREGVTFVVGGTTSPAAQASASTTSRPASRPARARPTISGPQAPARRTPSGPRRGPPTAGAIADEAQRMAEVEMMRFGPIQQMRQALFRYNAGTFFQPRYIVGALFAMVSGGFVMCTGAAAWIWTRL